MVEERERERWESIGRWATGWVWEAQRCNGESEREMHREEEWEIGIAGEQLRTRATYDSTLADYVRRGAERFDKTQFSLREQRFHGLINISVRIGRDS